MEGWLDKSPFLFHAGGRVSLHVVYQGKRWQKNAEWRSWLKTLSTGNQVKVTLTHKTYLNNTAGDHVQHTAQ